MTKGYPTKEEAKNLIKQVVEYRRQNPPEKVVSLYIEEEFVVHTKNVAESAEKIASRTSYLNPEKAYILGLLHDQGKRIDEKSTNKFHGKDGYEQMLEMGYKEVAKVCLTHTFPTKEFNSEDFWYPKEWQDWIRKELENVEYDDYDRLIQFCDKIAEGLTMISIEERANKIVSRYGLGKEVLEQLILEGMQLKKYFDDLCGEDVYKILGVEVNNENSEL